MIDISQTEQGRDTRVLSALLSRRSGKKDNRKIGVIFEGGGLRAIFSSAVACGLDDLKLREHFDNVYGSSAGSCVGGYFLSGQIEMGTTVFYEDLDAFKFIKPWHVSRMMDIDYLERVFGEGPKKLNLANLALAKPELKVYVSDYKTGKPYCFTNKSNVDMLDAIIASCSAAGFCNKPIWVSGKECLDGNIAKKLPIEEALADGCTDILVVPTVPESHIESEGLFANALKSFLMRPLSKRYRKAYRKRAAIYNNNLDIAFGRKKLDNGVRIYTMAPDYPTSEAEIRRHRLIKVANFGKAKVIQAFGQENVE